MLNSKYTIQLSQIVEYQGSEEVERWFCDYELSDFLTSEQIDTINRAGIWTKEKLAKKIVRHYMFREIGSETMGLFKERAKYTMEEIMEYYLPVIYSQALKYDPLVNVDYTETYDYNRTSKDTQSGNASSTGSGESSGLSVNSDTPQGQLNKSEILSGKYASSTSAIENENSTSSSTNSSSSSNGSLQDNYTKTIKGNSGVSATVQKMIEQYRDIIITTDKNIISELNLLFMGIY